METTENWSSPRGFITEQDGLHIWAGTWNLQSCSVSSADRLENWLKGPIPDVVAVGLQEFVELDARSVFKFADGAPKAKIDGFTRTFEAAMLKVWKRSYRLVRKCSMVGQFLAVYVCAPLSNLISEIDGDRVKSGVDGIFGNKGAVCVRFQIQGYGTICFCNVHLASGVAQTEDRKANLRQLFVEAFQGTSQRGHVRKPKNGYNRASIYKPHLHDAAFILGDFNFRLIPGDGDALSRDQFLCKVSADQWVYNHFAECQISFPPSYKYVVGTKLLDKRREPAWCDRILFSNSGQVQPLCYDSATDLIFTSDHRPVMASFLWSKDAAVRRMRLPNASRDGASEEVQDERRFRSGQFENDLELAIKLSEATYREERARRKSEMLRRPKDIRPKPRTVDTDTGKIDATMRTNRTSPDVRAGKVACTRSVSPPAPAFASTEERAEKCLCSDDENLFEKTFGDTSEKPKKITHTAKVAGRTDRDTHAVASNTRKELECVKDSQNEKVADVHEETQHLEQQDYDLLGLNAGSPKAVSSARGSVVMGKIVAAEIASSPSIMKGKCVSIQDSVGDQGSKDSVMLAVLGPLFQSAASSADCSAPSDLPGHSSEPNVSNTNLRRLSAVDSLASTVTLPEFDVGGSVTEHSAHKDRPTEPSVFTQHSADNGPSTVVASFNSMLRVPHRSKSSPVCRERTDSMCSTLDMKVNASKTLPLYLDSLESTKNQHVVDGHVHTLPPKFSPAPWKEHLLDASSASEVPIVGTAVPALPVRGTVVPNARSTGQVLRGVVVDCDSAVAHPSRNSAPGSSFQLGRLDERCRSSKSRSWTDVAIDGDVPRSYDAVPVNNVTFRGDLTSTGDAASTSETTPTRDTTPYDDTAHPGVAPSDEHCEVESSANRSPMSVSGTGAPSFFDCESPHRQAVDGEHVAGVERTRSSLSVLPRSPSARPSARSGSLDVEPVEHI